MASIIKKQSAEEKKGKTFFLIFFTMFAIGGIAMLYLFGIKPLTQVIKARNWPSVPCKIISAKVGSHTGDDSVTYSIDIVYKYQFNGKTYESDRYDFMGGSSGGYENKAKVVRQYKNEKNPICFINPDNPSQAVLHKGLHKGFFWGLFPLPFAAVGIGGLIWAAKNWARDKSSKTDWLPKSKTASIYETAPSSNISAQPVILKSKSPWVKFGISIAVAAFWNGLISVFIFNIIREWQNGAGSIFKTLFFVPFVIVGIGLICFVIYCFLALFNPRPTIYLGRCTIPLGGITALKWSFSGRTSIIRNLEIFLKGIEKSKYQKDGKDSIEQNTFFKMQVYSTQNPREISFGTTGLVIPSDSMHSFETKNNKVVWQVEVNGTIDSWPDVKENFELIVTPA